MALDARSRSSIYRKLVPTLGEHDANVLMSEFPSVEADELVTKQFLRAELAELRLEFRADMTGLRAELGDLRGEFGGLRAELSDLRGEFGGLRGEFGSLRGEFGGLRGEVRAGLSGCRAEIAELESRISERLREQATWMAGALVTGMGVAAGIGSLLG